MFEPAERRIDARRREVHPGGASRADLDQPEQQAATPATKLEHRPASQVDGGERVSKANARWDKTRILAFHQALGRLGVELPRDPSIVRAGARLLFRVGLQVRRVA